MKIIIYIKTQYYMTSC